MRQVRETGKPIAQIARELGVNEGTLGNWCAKDREALMDSRASPSGQSWIGCARRTELRHGRAGDLVRGQAGVPRARAAAVASCFHLK